MNWGILSSNFLMRLTKRKQRSVLEPPSLLQQMSFFWKSVVIVLRSTLKSYCYSNNALE